MWATDSYVIDISDHPERLLAVSAERVFDAAWGFDSSAPGFSLLDLSPEVDSHGLQSLMLGLKERLREVAARLGLPQFTVRSLGRFDQQETTRLRLDGAPERSLLVLGYEPSEVRSRLRLAGYTRCAHDLKIGPRRFLDEFNPMSRKGEEMLGWYVTELPEPAAGTAASC